MFLLHILFIFQQLIVLNILQQIGIDNPFEILVYTSPIMLMCTAYIYYQYGKTIEIIDNIKTGANFIKENKHHARPVYDKVKQIFGKKEK